MSGSLRVALDVANLSDPARTGIPLYVESLLREYLRTPGDEEWTLFGFDPRTDLTPLLQERGIARAELSRLIPAAETRLGTRFPVSGPMDWFVRKWDGRVALPLNRAATTHRLAKVRPDIVHHTGALRVQPGRFRRNIVTIYDLTTRLYPEAHSAVNIAEWERVFALAQNHADLVITDSESAKADIVEHLGISPDRVRAILLGIRPLATDLSAETRNAIRTKFDLGDSRFVLAVGSLDPRKNLPRLIEAFAGLVREPDFCDLRLVLTGAALHGAVAVEEAIRAQKMERHILRTGYVNDEELTALMMECACFVYPSLYEGFGLPVAEAMALGAPVVTSDTSSLPEVAGGATLLISPQSVLAIREGMERVLSDASLANELRRRGYIRAAELTWKRCADEHRSAYHELVY